MEKLCAICKSNINSEDSSILVMGGFGNPRYICKDCEKHLDIITLGTQYGDIKKSIEILGERMTASNVDDELTFDTMESIFSTAKDRAEAIKNGTYDFSKDEIKDVTDTDIPEELRETEEDRKLDEEEQLKKAEEIEKTKKFDRMFTYPFLGVAIIGFIVYIVVTRFF